MNNFFINLANTDWRLWVIVAILVAGGVLFLTTRGKGGGEH